MFDPNTVSQIVAVVLMIAPSASDDHLENHSIEVDNYTFEVSEGEHPLSAIDACEELASKVNQLQIHATYEGEVHRTHAWCKPIWD